MAKRQQIAKAIEIELLVHCRRRCCLCFYLHGRDEVRRGQIAHINHDPSNGTIDNLAYLCFEHHDEFDSRTSQSKGLTNGEIRVFRDRLHRHFEEADARLKPPSEPEETVTDEVGELPSFSNSESYAQVRKKDKFLDSLLSRQWRFAGWGVTANQPEYFAFKAGNGCDGVCLIERIDLPDERIVIACIETSGNPGQSITNAIEVLAFQVCERLEIPPGQLVWLEHYEIPGHESYEWDWVRFEKTPPEAAFEGPVWVTMTDDLWTNLRLKPRKVLRPDLSGWQYQSKLKKIFPWPP